MTEIVDVIMHKNKYDTQMFIVLDQEPKHLYERENQWLIAEDSGVFDFYYHRKPDQYSKAFAGKEFSIPLKDGSVAKADGQWWHGCPESYSDLVYETGYGTKEGLGRCNVFAAIWVDKKMVDDWLKNNEPSNNYHKYDKRSEDYGKHTIKSRWG